MRDNGRMRSRRPFRRSNALAFVLAVACLAPACSYTTRQLAPQLPANAQTSSVFAADGTLITTLHAEENRTELTLDEIPEELQNAVIAIEDERFWLHNGVDVRAILRAVRVNASSGGVSQGGSTITQQLVKNLFLGREQTLERKIQEAALAIQLERRYSKQRILELYLNTIYFGNGAYGVEAAAREYFGANVADLTVAQSALLAGLIQAPGDADPYSKPEEAVARRNVVLDGLLEQGFIDQATHDAAIVEPLTLAPDVPVLEERYAAAYFVEEVKQWILDDRRFGATRQERRQLLFAGGLQITTTVDLRMQAAAEAAAAAILPNAATDPEVAIASLEPQTGYVRAMVGGRDFFGGGEQAKYNLAMGKGRPTGSSFKPLVLAAALQEGVPLSATFVAPGTMNLTYGSPPRIWNVGNYGEGGPGVPVTLTEATVHSYNTVFAQLILRVGPERAIDIAASLGITTPMERFPSAVLGANDVQPLEMASAYATIANGGVHVDPVFVLRIERIDGTILYEAEHEQERVVDRDVAEQVTAVLEQVIERGTGTAAQLGRPAAGKTGTAQAWRDAWFCGFVPQLATAVWVGYPGDQVSMVPPRTPIRVTGGSYPARIWQRYMAAAVEPLTVAEFAIPASTTTTAVPGASTTSTTGVPQVLPNVVGMAAEQATSTLQSLGFRVRRTTNPDSGAAPGSVIAQSPPGGTLTPTGALVTIEVAQPSATVVMANVLGMEEQAATATLTNQGFHVSVRHQQDPGNSAQPGRVWAQSPSPGAVVSRGAVAQLYVAPDS